MDLGVAVVSGFLGAGGIISFVQFMISRHDQKDGRLARIETKIDNLQEKGDRNELATTRLQLFFLMTTQPNNVDTIQKTAYRYFIELDGNGEAWSAFKVWAEEHKVDTDFYKALLQREKERSKK